MVFRFRAKKPVWFRVNGLRFRIEIPLSSPIDKTGILTLTFGQKVTIF